MLTGYVIGGNSHHDLSPDARLVTTYGPVTKKGSAVNTINARTAPRTVKYLLTTGEGTKMFRRLSRSKKGRARLLTIGYRSGVAVALQQNPDAGRDVKHAAGRKYQNGIRSRIQRIAAELKQANDYVRANRISPVVDRRDPSALHYCAAGAIDSAGCGPFLARDIPNVVSAQHEHNRPDYLQDTDSPYVKGMRGADTYKVRMQQAGIVY